MKKDHSVCPHCNGTGHYKGCGNCIHFIQHYGKDGIEINCGHCRYPNIKSRRPGDKACKDWESVKSEAAGSVDADGGGKKNTLLQK